MFNARVFLCLLCCLAPALGCRNAEENNAEAEQAVQWPTLDLDDGPDKNVRPPSWYRPSKEYAPWPLGEEPKYGTDEWRSWCSLRYNSRDVIRPVTTPPTIDGKLDDDAWKHSALQPVFQNTAGAVARPRTTVYAAYDEDHLYLAARMEELYPAQLKAHATRPVPRIRFDDHLSIQLAPNWKDKTFETYWVLVNSKGVFLDARDSDVTWNSELKVAATVGQKSWQVELAIPLRSLGVKKDPWGDVWACCFVRHRYAGGRHEVSSWTRLLDERTGASNWGHLIFKGVRPPARKPAPPAKKTAPSPPEPSGAKKGPKVRTE